MRSTGKRRRLETGRVTLDPAGGPARPRAARVCAVVASCTCATPLGSGRFHPGSSPQCLGVLPVTLGLAQAKGTRRCASRTPRGHPGVILLCPEEPQSSQGGRGGRSAVRPRRPGGLAGLSRPGRLCSDVPSATDSRGCVRGSGKVC